MGTMQSKLFVDRPNASLPTESIQQAVDLFRVHGALWIENAFPKSTIENLRLAYQKKYLRLSKKELRKRDAAVGDQRFMITVDIKGPFRCPHLYANEAVMPILRRLLSPELRIASFGSVVALPGAGNQAIHLDHPPLFDREADRLSAAGFPTYALTLVIPLVDLSPDTGATAIWEGSHRGNDRFDLLQRLMEKPNYSSAVIPYARQGDAYLMDYRVIHGGMANGSVIPRPILYIVYSRPWFRDGFNFKTQQPVSISRKQFKKIPKTYRQLFE